VTLITLAELIHFTGIFCFRIETRLKAIDNLLLVLNKHYIPDSVDKWKCSIIDVVEKSLRRSQQDEAQRVCSLASLVSLQLGVEIEDQICEPVAQMRQICADDSASEQMRSCCAQAIGLCVYLSIEVFHSFSWTSFDKFGCSPEPSTSFRVPADAERRLVRDEAIFNCGNHPLFFRTRLVDSPARTGKRFPLTANFIVSS
jgi:hypothetical protein